MSDRSFFREVLDQLRALWRVWLVLLAVLLVLVILIVLVLYGPEALLPGVYREF